MYRIGWTTQKALYAAWGALVSFTQEVHTAMLGLVICILADTITGFIAAPYRGEIRKSAKLSNVVKKMSLLKVKFRQTIVVQLLSYVQLFVTPWTAAHQGSLSFTVSWNLLKLMSIKSMIPSGHLILCLL